LVENIIVAYTLAEPLTADTLVIHFEKGCPAYKGGYQAINRMFLAHAADGFQFVNREQDPDSEGLRKASCRTTRSTSCESESDIRLSLT